MTDIFLRTGHPPTRHHNSELKIARMVEQGLIPKVGGFWITSSHDEWCDFAKKTGFCNCDPLISVKPAAIE